LLKITFWNSQGFLIQFITKKFDQLDPGNTIKNAPTPSLTQSLIHPITHFMSDLLFATNNSHKLREIQEILGNEFRILSLKDARLEIDIPETQETIEGNASQKAWFIYEKTGMNCFADDTGLEIEALAGRPGVYSARYAGEGCSFDDNIDKILEELSGIANRKACFRCVICLIMNGREHLFEGRIDGVITTERNGTDGFGYDPVFLPDGYSQTFAGMPAYLKNGISHRGRAAEKMRKSLKKCYLGNER
jgi:XTP/dITP diphosphohydrolase